MGQHTVSTKCRVRLTLQDGSSVIFTEGQGVMEIDADENRRIERAHRYGIPYMATVQLIDDPDSKPFEIEIHSWGESR